MIYLVWGRSDILQSYFTSKALVLAKHLFSAIFESVDEDHFLKNRSHTDLRLQRYSEVAENNLGLMKNVSITKYKICLPPCNSVTLRLLNLKFSGDATFDIYFISQKGYFLKKYFEAVI
jgi:hypothetical protein